MAACSFEAKLSGRLRAMELPSLKAGQGELTRWGRSLTGQIESSAHAQV